MHRKREKTCSEVLKTSFIWTKQALVRDVLVEGIPISIYPFEVPHDARITVVTDSVYYVLQPLHVSSLLGAPFLVIDQREGDMVCEIYHYKAEKPKQFWDLRWPGAFYKGRPACLFLLGNGRSQRYSFARGAASASGSG